MHSAVWREDARDVRSVSSAALMVGRGVGEGSSKGVDEYHDDEEDEVLGPPAIVGETKRF